MSRPIEIRGHTLLCLQGFRGEGYSPEFVENMRHIWQSLQQNPEQLILPICRPDTICAACPHLKNSGCTLRHSQSEIDMLAQDEEVLSRLEIEKETPIAWNSVLDRIRKHISGSDLQNICGQCPWLPLGYCKEGIDRL